MAKFDNAKVGDRVWYIIKGWGEVERVIKNVGIRVRFKVSETVEVSEVFTFDGKRYQLNDKYPMLFWDEVKLPTDEDDKRFDLVEFLKDNIEPTEFVTGAENVTFVYNYTNNTWEIGIYNFTYIETIYISKISEEDYLFNDILDVLIEKQVTPQQLKRAYKDLGWL